MNEEILPHVDEVKQVAQGDQVLIGGQGNEVPVVPQEMANWEIRETLLTLARALTTHVNIGMVPRVSVVERTMTSRLRDFVRMSPPIFLVFKVGEDPQEFIDEMYKIVYAMGVTSREKVELASY